MPELVRTDTGQRLSIHAANKLLGGKTIITEKTTSASLAYWGDQIGVGAFAWVQPTERPGDDYRLHDTAEQGTDNIWRQVWVPVEHDIEQLRAQALLQINTHFQQLADQQAGQYPGFEVSTWRDQEAESLAYQRWVANGSVAAEQPACAMLTAIAQQRSIPLAELVTRVINNATAWRTLAATLAGQRQAAADAIAAATDKPAIDAILADLPPLEQA